MPSPRVPGATPGQAWELNLLGVPALGRPGRESFTLERKTAALLAVLALDGPTSRARLAGLLWPVTTESGARNNLRQLLHRLRSKTGLVEGTDPLRIGEAVRVDAHAAERIAGFTPGLNGDLLAGLDLSDCPELEEWALVQRERLLSEQRELLERHAEASESSGDHRTAIELARRLVEIEPLNEAHYRRLMRLHHEAGDTAGAIQIYRDLAWRLRSHVDAEPSGATTALFEELRGRPAVAATGAATMFRPARLPLVGRAEEMASLEQGWRAGQILLLAGEPGVGKTRLAREFLAGKGEFITVEGRPFDSATPLRTIRRAFDGIVGTQAAPGLPAWVHARLRRVGEGSVRLSSATLPQALAPAAGELLDRIVATTGRVLFDDLQDWDAASQAALVELLERDAGTAAHCLVIAWQGRALAPVVGVALGRLAEDGRARMISLGGLAAGAVAELAKAACAGLGEADAGWVAGISRGNPLTAVEAIHAIGESGAIDPKWRGDPHQPAPLPAIVEHRLGQLTATARDLVRFQSLAAGNFTVESALRCLGRGLPELLEGMQELERKAFLEAGRFRNEEVREAVERTIPDDLRRFLSERLAAGLEESRADPATTGRRWLAAGRPERAAPHLLRAATIAEEAALFAEAATLAEQALTAAGDDPRLRAEAVLCLERLAARQVDREAREHWLELLRDEALRTQDEHLLIEWQLRHADHLCRTGQAGRATEVAAGALGDARRIDDPGCVERATLAMGGARFFAGDFEGARAFFEEVSTASDPATAVRGLSSLGAALGMLGRNEEAHQRLEEGLTLARRRDQTGLLGQLLNNLGATAERLAWYQRCRRHLADAADLARTNGDADTLVRVLVNAAVVATSAGRLSEAMETAHAARQVAQSKRAPDLVAVARFASGLTLRRIGLTREAAEDLSRSHRLRERAGDRRGSAMALFNLELVRHEEGDAEAIDRAGALLRWPALASVPYFAALGWLELASLQTVPAKIAGAAREARGLATNRHIDLIAAVATVRAGLLGGASASQRRHSLEGLEAAIGGERVLETSLAHLLAAASHEALGNPELATRHRTAAGQALEQETRGLPASHAEARRRLVANRVGALRVAADAPGNAQ